MGYSPDDPVYFLILARVSNHLSGAKSDARSVLDPERDLLEAEILGHIQVALDKLEELEERLDEGDEG